MQLAIFDLDHTLMPLDTGELWVRWLLRASGRDPSFAVSTIERFTREYRAGKLDVNEFFDFQMKFLASFKRSFLEEALKSYAREILLPNVPQRSRDLVGAHKKNGHMTAICTATYSFVTQAAADIFGVDVLLATRPGVDEKGEFTGKIIGTPSYGPGKVQWVKEFVSQYVQKTGKPFEKIWFYSDSAADLPLFEFVEGLGGVNTVVNGESALIERARRSGWATAETFDKEDLARTRQLQEQLVEGCFKTK